MEETYPDAVRPFIAIGFEPTQKVGEEYLGECPFCGKKKFYLNTKGLYSCKAGSCQVEGNIHTFIREYYNGLTNDDAPWELLSRDRGIPEETLRNSGIKWDEDRWVIPSFDKDKKLVTVAFYELGGKIHALAGSIPGTKLTGLENKNGSTTKIFLCEGFWDLLALKEILKNSEEKNYAVLSSPGCGVFKAGWEEELRCQNLYCLYDNDSAGKKGAEKVRVKTKGHVGTFYEIRWPEGLPVGFDVRDAYISGMGWEQLSSLFSRSISEALEKPEPTQKIGQEGSPKVYGELRVERDFENYKKGRPLLSTTLSEFRKWLFMTQEMVDGLRVIMATIIANQIPGDPLWMHIVAPPGSGKTEMLTSCANLRQCIIQSSIGAHTLVSGWPGAGGSDPSLIPQLLGKVFILKDYTEILQMNQNSREEVYKTLRGAYDGSVDRDYGNGIKRRYSGTFGMVTGVTPAIFGERSSILGERFLLCHVVKETSYRSDDAIMAAIGNVGDEPEMRKNLQEIMARFLEWSFEPTEIPTLSQEYAVKLVALAQLVSMLRASVEKDMYHGTINYRPQQETGTRIAKQLKKLFMGLVMQNPDLKPTPEDWRVTTKVALDTCIGFHLDLVQELMARGPATGQELSERTKIPLQTLRDRIEDLRILEVVETHRDPEHDKRGRPSLYLKPSKLILDHWERAGLPMPEPPASRMKMRIRPKRASVKPPIAVEEDEDEQS